jgi:hypothetical protein
LLGQRLYVRGKHVGVEDTHTGRRHRFVKLGVAEAYQEQHRRWGRNHERIQVIERVELERARREWIELGYRGDLVSILGSHFSAVALSERERRCLTKIERVLRGRNLRQRDYELAAYPVER